MNKIEKELRKINVELDSAEINREVHISKEFIQSVFPAESWSNETQTHEVVDKIIKAIDKKLNEEEFTSLAKNIQDRQTRKYGFFWELAAASFLDFPDGNMGYSLVPKLGIWTTATYRLANQKFDFIGTFRFIKDFQMDANAYNLDYGGSLVFSVHHFSFAGEYLQRFQNATIETIVNEDGYKVRTSKTRFDYRATLNISYLISPGIVVAYSFGKNFGLSEDTNNDLINQLSLNFGIGRVPLKL